MGLPPTKSVRCATKKCGSVVIVEAVTVAASNEGHWQFYCPQCKYWNLASRTNAVQATSPTPFDLERLPPSLRGSFQVKRSPSGGI